MSRFSIIWIVVLWGGAFATVHAQNLHLTFDEALRRGEENVARLKQAYGEGSYEAVRAEAMLGSVKSIWYPLECVPPARRYLKLAEENYSLTSPQVCEATTCLSHALEMAGRVREAEPFARQSVAVARQLYGPTRAERQKAEFSLCSILLALENFAEAERNILELDRGFELGHVTAKDSAFVPANRVFLGDLYMKTGRYGEALAAYTAAESMYLERRSDSSYFAIHSQGRALLKLGRLPEAKRAFERAVSLKNFGMVPGQAFSGLGLVARKQGDEAAAEAYWLKTINGPSGPIDPADMETRLYLADLYVEQRRFSAAQEQIEAVRRLLNENFGEFSAYSASVELSEALLLRGMGRMDEALRAADRARHIMHKLSGSVLPTMHEVAQREFVAQTDAPSLHTSLWLAVAAGDAELSAEWVINGKGNAQRAAAERVLAARGATDPRAARLFEDWVDVRAQLARFANQPSGVDAESRRSRLADLESRERDLAREVGQVASIGQSEWITLDRVRAEIPKDAVLIEFILAGPPAWGSKTGSEFLAWIIPAAGQGKVRSLRMGDAADIQETIRDALAAIDSTQEGTTGNVEHRATNTVRDALTRLAKKLVEPLHANMGDRKRWILCPDQDLWLVPWAALPVGENAYLVENHIISLVTSGKQLADEEWNVASANPAMMLADPDFDRTEHDRAPSPNSLIAVDDSTIDSSLRASLVGKFSRIPGTASEAAYLRPLLTDYLAAEPDVYLGVEATEERFRRAYRPRVMVLSTHGYYLGAEGPASILRSANPLERCGLALAGANAEHSANDADGLLTGLEIVATDLTGTELVVLSACETGLGELTAGEGVVGLRQAFELAGARSVLASLWRVSDDATAELMTLFFHDLAEGCDKAEALARAQRTMIERERAKLGEANPALWAAFTLSGAWRRPNDIIAYDTRPKMPNVARVIVDVTPVKVNRTVLGYVTRGDVLVVRQRQDDWVYVDLPDGSATGWIKSDQLDLPAQIE